MRTLSGQPVTVVEAVVFHEHVDHTGSGAVVVWSDDAVCEVLDYKSC